jgi:hypothetical protein
MSVEEKPIDVTSLWCWRDCGCGGRHSHDYIKPVPGKLYEAQTALGGGLGEAKIKKGTVMMFLRIEKSWETSSHHGINYVFLHKGSLYLFGGSMIPDNFKRVL